MSYTPVDNLNLRGTTTAETPANPAEDSTVVPTTEWVNDAIAAAVGGVALLDDVGNVDDSAKVNGSLFYYLTGASEWRAAADALYVGGQLQLTTAGAGAGVVLGSRQWYDDGSNMRTPDDIYGDQDITVLGGWNAAAQSTIDGARIRAVNLGGGGDVIVGLEAGDSAERMQLQTNALRFGDGISPADVAVYRPGTQQISFDAVNGLSTNGTFTAGGRISTPDGLTVGASETHRVRSPVNTYSINEGSDYVVPANGGATISLPSNIDAGDTYVVVNADGTAGSSPITIDTNGPALINGAASVSISTNYGALRFTANSSANAWYIT